MTNVLVIPWAYEEWNLVQFFQEYMLASLYMLIRQFSHIRFIVLSTKLAPLSSKWGLLKPKLAPLSPKLAQLIAELAHLSPILAHPSPELANLGTQIGQV